MAADSGKVAVGLLAQFHPGNIPDADDLGGFRRWLLTMISSNCSVFSKRPKVLRVNWKACSGGDGGPPNLAGRHLDVLPPQGLQHLNGGQIIILEAVGIQPDPHAVRPGADDPDQADSGQAGQRVLQIDDRVIGEKGFVEFILFRVEADHQQDIGGDLFDGDALLLDTRAVGRWRCLHSSAPAPTRY